MPMNLDHYLMIATETAQYAGKYVAQMAGKVSRVHYKSTTDIVTEVDLHSEKMIIERIRHAFPDHAMLTEEAGVMDTTSPFKWVIDPLDGTVNFSHGFPCYCISIALEYNGEVIVGVVNDVTRNELFYATKGGGAFLNNNPIHVSGVMELEKSLLATGFPYDVRTNMANLKHFQNFLLVTQAIRRPGSAAIDLCCVACGRFDGFWEDGLHAWDMAAGNLIVQEAGGMVTDMNGSPHDLYSGRVLANNGLLHAAMLKVLNP